MSESYTGKKRVRKNFGRIEAVADMPNLIDVQTGSYSSFINNVENSSDKIINDKDSYKLSLEDLKKKYSYLLDNIIISDNCDYLSDFYNHNITYELKNYISALWI